MEVKGMMGLFYDYVRALFIIGCHVRDCHWGPYVNCIVSTLLYQCWLHVFIRLTLGYEHKIKFICTFMVALLRNHHPWFSRLPGLPFSEEPCEPRLSHLLPKIARYPHIDNFEQVHDLFVVVIPSPKWQENGLHVL